MDGKQHSTSSSIEPKKTNEGALITAEHNVPSEFDTGCDLKVVVSGRSGDWNGDVTFLADDQEILLIGLHPERRNVAVRNDVFKRGTLQWGYQWVMATYPKADNEGKREYTFEFTPTGFVLKCGDTILITIPYEELTNDKEEFLSSINSVKFKLSTEQGPILLQFARKCNRLNELKTDGKDIRENYLPSFEYCPVMIPPTPLSKFIHKIYDWKPMHSLKKTDSFKAFEKGRHGYEAEVKLLRVLERMKVNEEFIVLHSLEYMHSDYQHFVGKHRSIKGKNIGEPCLPLPDEIDKIDGECDFVIMGRNYFVIVEVKQADHDENYAKRQAERTAKLIEGIAKISDNAVPPKIFKFGAFPYTEWIYDDTKFSRLWRKNILNNLSNDEQSGQPMYEETKNVLIALWANNNKKTCEKERCSLGWNIQYVDEKLKEGIITFEPKKKAHSNPFVVKAPDYVPVKYFTTEQDRVILKFKHNNMLWINGPAGSGKTVLLAEKMIQLARSDNHNGEKVIVFSFTGPNNNSSLYRTTCDKAGVGFDVIPTGFSEHPSFSLCWQITEYGHDYRKRVVIVESEISRRFHIRWFRNILQCLSTYDYINVIVDDIQCLFHDFRSIDNISTILKSLKRLSDKSNVLVACDLAQTYFFFGDSIFAILAGLFDKHFSKDQLVTITHNLRNTRDISDILSVIRNQLVEYNFHDNDNPNIVDKIFPKQESGHFIRGPMTVVHVFNINDDANVDNVAHIGDILKKEVNNMCRNNDLNSSKANVAVLYNHDDIRNDYIFKLIELEDTSGNITDKITVCNYLDSFSSEWPAVIVLHGTYDYKGILPGIVYDLSRLYLAISRARVKCSVLLIITENERSHISELLDNLKPIAHVIKH